MLITDTGLFFSRGKRGKEITVRSYLRQKKNTEKLLQAIADDKALKNQLKSLRINAKLKPEIVKSDDKLIRDFSTTIYHADDVNRVIYQFCEKVDAYKFCDKKTAYKAAEILLYCEVENRLTDELIFVAENWIK